MYQLKQLGIALLILLTGCTAVVHQDYDPQTNFDDYQTFAWTNPDSHPVKDPVLDSQLLEQRVKAAVVDVMIAKGYQQKDKAEADMLVTYHTGSKDKLRQSPFSVGVGYSRHFRHWNTGVFFGDSISSYEQAVLIIDVIDAKSEKLVWRGWDTDVLSQANFSAAAIKKMVEKILSAYPPKR